jgi:hypothetical protein
MRKLLVCLFVLAIQGRSSAAQAQHDHTAETNPAPEAVVGARRYEVVKAQLEPSYITILGGAGDIQPLLFEADIAPHFALAWRTHGFVATAKVLFRMFNDSTRSAPIRTPSFMPHLTWYYWGFRSSADSDRVDLVSVRYSHHSNGQSGPFHFSDTTEPNTTDGSFSTNFIEVMYHRAYGAAPALQATWLRYGLRIHIPFNEDRELRDSEGDDQYGRYRLLLGGQRRGILPIFPWLKLPFIARAEYFYILDRHFQGEPFFSRDRLGFSLTWISVIPADVSLGFFVDFYAGQDYYNIWYKQYLTILRVGFTAQSITTLLAPR